jgi:hypothetical protein
VTIRVAAPISQAVFAGGFGNKVARIRFGAEIDRVRHHGARWIVALTTVRV